MYYQWNIKEWKNSVCLIANKSQDHFQPFLSTSLIMKCTYKYTILLTNYLRLVSKLLLLLLGRLKYVQCIWNECI